MKNTLDFTQEDLNALGESADRLVDWLEQQEQNPVPQKSRRLPGPLTVFATLALASTSVMILDEIFPDSIGCWGGDGLECSHK